MKKICLLISGLVLGLLSHGQTGHALSLVPEPVSLVQQDGVYTLPSKAMIETGNDPDIKKVAALFIPVLSRSTGYTIGQTAKGPAAIHLVLNRKRDPEEGEEGYRLTVSAAGIGIRANRPAGLFYGMQTLLQLFPREIQSREPVPGFHWTVPYVKILDYPRFAWRGLMFDVVRHFFTKGEVKKYIDEMVRYKYNLLHLHLTDDQGWRIEIKSLPRLTELGAWRVPRVGYWGHFTPPSDSEAATYGGFYTQDDIRDIIQYARDRFVTILPEIDVPGHSMAAVASYPDLSCTPGKYRVNSGEEFISWSDTGLTAHTDNTLCPANENVYVFLDKVFTEVAKLFPFQYIHVGGDECAKNFWAKSEAVQALMKREGLKTLEEVQSYFEKRVEKIVESKGKKVIGWDEILEGGLAPGAAVMSWRGMKGGTEAAKMGHEVVMTPTTNCYIDLYQGDPVIEPHTYSMLRLKEAYAFEPVPDSVDPKLILGGQANLWTESVATFRHAEYMTWPRALATAECLWTPKGEKNWDDFTARVEKEFGRMDEAGIKYARSMFDPIFEARKDSSGQLQVSLSTEVSGLDIYYSFDESNPDQYYPKYTSPLSIPKDAVHLKVITYRHGRPIGQQINMPVEELKKRAGILPK